MRRDQVPALHWTIAVSVLGALVTGYATTRSTSFSPTLLQLHITLGSAAGLLSILRVLVWISKGPPPRVFLVSSTIQAVISSIVHGFLRLLPLVLLASGFGMVALSGAFEEVVGGTLKNLTAFAELPPRNLHHAAAFLLLLLVGFHTLAACWHWLRRPSYRTS